MPRPEVFDSSARYRLANYGGTCESIPMAYDTRRLTKRTTVVTDSAVPLNSIRIQTALSRVLPPKGSLLIPLSKSGGLIPLSKGRPRVAC